jgi:hypothetical protein
MAKRKPTFELESDGDSDSDSGSGSEIQATALTPQFIGAVTLAFFEACKASSLNLATSKSGGFWVSEKDGNRVHISVDRLARLVGGKEPGRWPEMMQRFLEIAGPLTSTRTGETPATRLQKSRSRLLPFIKPADEVSGTPQPWSLEICRMEAQQNVFMQMFGSTVDVEEATRRVRQAARDPATSPNLLSVMLAIDHPKKTTLVTADMIGQSDQPGDKWLQLARRNLRARTPADWFILVDGQSEICCTSVNDGYDSGRALLLDKLLPEKAERGWFVAPITRDDVYFVPAASANARAALFQMKRHAERRYGLASNSLSKEVFWVYQGKWYLFPFIEVDGHPVGVPPVEYQRVFGLGPQPGIVTIEPPGVKKLVPTRIFGCPHCGKPLSAQQKFAGKVAKCPGCGRSMQVPK